MSRVSLKSIFAVTFVCALGPLSIGSAIAETGDYYMRSSIDTGKFNGSHEVSTVPLDGYYKTSFCNIRFWMRGTTVAWSEEEVAAGRQLIIIQETENGRRTVCRNAGQYVAANMKRLPKKYKSTIEGPKRSRLNVIGEAFKGFK